MSKAKTATTVPGGTAATVSTDAVAIGVNTLTMVGIDVTMKQHGAHSATITTKGTATIVAAADSPGGGPVYVDATLNLDLSGADKVKIKTKETSGSDGTGSYEILEVKFKVVDHLNKSGDLTIKEVVHEIVDNSHDPFSLDGNVAIVSFDAQALGTDTLATADAFALALQDTLSESALTITLAVG